MVAALSANPHQAAAKQYLSFQSLVKLRLCLFRERAGAAIGGKIIGAGRSETDRCKYRETARAIEPPSECAIRRGGSAAIALMVFNG
jgi:hypothetical protein